MAQIGETNLHARAKINLSMPQPCKSQVNCVKLKRHGNRANSPKSDCKFFSDRLY